ncbi:MAG: deoxyguanosinetriphosphate triphosphohydrolase [Chloroflexi bacterium]|nr:deoxyguanosinetriphosphate triphosphohydrolase [Chloroflexota bacterium]MQC26048.1 deoxyguanosinetriphosphate triphosphohydrolase [Chloroflexota bacterium]
MSYTREKLEELEDQALAPYGMRSRNSKGRAHPDKEPNYRTSYQRDRDRILHTTAFRRLEYKTQVFINFEGDYFRTRLTHTLEVAQVGRTIARALGANEDLIETICLAHDLGHAAFGHSGERVLNKLLAEQGGFDHNKQSLRIVTKLEERYPNFPGLNLTWEVLEGIVKHETQYDISDASDYDPELRGNLEAQIANVADELAYTTHDLDDGLRSGMLTPDMLSGLQMWDMLVKNVGWSGSALTDLDRHRLIRRLIGILVSDVIEATSERIEKSKANSPLDLQKLDHNVIGYSDKMQPLNDEIKAFLYANLYQHHRVVRMAYKAEHVLKKIFVAYKENHRMLPPESAALTEKRGLERTIGDYLAGMTDRYAIQEYERLFDPSERA